MSISFRTPGFDCGASRALFEPVLDRECCLYGNLLDYDETEYEDEEWTQPG